MGVDLADDLAAETFAQAFGSRAKYQLDCPSALPWLYGIAANVLRNYRRAEERRLRAYARVGAEASPESHEQRVDVRLDARASASALAGALARLSPRNREVLLLSAWADLSYAEIARALQIPPGTVRSRLNRARGSIKDALVAGGHYVSEPEPLSCEA